jgi:hypothetical protein
LTAQLLPETPLQNAVSRRDLERVREQLAAGADPNAPGTLGHTALHIAAARDQPAIIQALVDAGAQVDVRDEAGNTPLLVAATEQPPATAAIRALLRAHADPDAANLAGASPRAFALARRLPELTKIFARSPSDPASESVPRIEIAASTPSKLTLEIDGRALTFLGEPVIAPNGSTERILYTGDMAHYDDGTPLDQRLRPLIRSYLTAQRSVYEEQPPRS